MSRKGAFYKIALRWTNIFIKVFNREIELKVYMQKEVSKCKQGSTGTKKHDCIHSHSES
jgi:hypothetical protein